MTAPVAAVAMNACQSAQKSTKPYASSRINRALQAFPLYMSLASRPESARFHRSQQRALLLAHLEGSTMVQKLASAIGAALALVAFLGIAAMSHAQAAENVRVRGTIVSLDGSTLTVKTREGPDAALALKPGWKVTGVAKASVEDIKPGDFVGIASLPTAAGGDGAVEVLVFPPSMKGTGEGSYPWDLKPKSTMTNATVTNAVKDVDGRTVTLSYSGGQEKKISIPDGAPIVTFAPATEADLKPGATVFVPAQRGDDGALVTGFVVVGANGVVPPM